MKKKNREREGGRKNSIVGSERNRDSVSPCFTSSLEKSTSCETDSIDRGYSALLDRFDSLFVERTVDGARLSVKIKKIRKEGGRQGARGWFLRRVRFIITKTGPRLHRLNVARFASTHPHAHANTDGCPSSLSLFFFSPFFPTHFVALVDTR